MANSLKNPSWIFEFVLQKGKILNEIKRNLARKIKWIPGIHDFEELMFDLILLDCVTYLHFLSIQKKPLFYISTF